MHKNNIISFPRLLNLMLIDIRANSRSIWLLIGVIFLLCLINFQNIFFSDLNSYLIILFIAGLSLTGIAFTDLHERSKANLFLMLPCSNVERLLSKWFLTSFILVGVSLILFILASTVSHLISHILLNANSKTLSLFDASLWFGIKNYLIIQTVFLLGAVVFEKYSFVKTVITIGLFSLSLFGIFLLMVWWMFSSGYSGTKLLPFSSAFLNSGNYFYQLVLAPFCLYVAYLKIKEYELI